MTHTSVSRAALLLAGLALLSGCSAASSGQATTSAKQTTGSSPSSVSPTKVSPTTTSPTKGSPTKAPTSATAKDSHPSGECTDASILAALPAGSTLDKYQCAIVSPKMWAAARVQPGAKVYFLQTTSGPWKVSPANQICGTISAGLPKEIKDFCTNSS